MGMIQKHPIIIATLLAVLFIGGGKVLNKPRGIRNNNPGNIRFNPANDWLGQVGQDDAGYAIFETPEHGIRAMRILLTNYYNAYGLDTVDQVISRWAPPGDNNPTDSYIDHVVDELNKSQGVAQLTPITPFNVVARIPELVRAIIKHENGQNPYSDATIAAGLALA